MWYILIIVILLFLYRPLRFTVRPYVKEVHRLSVPLLEKNAGYSTFKRAIPKLDSVVHRDMVQLYQGGNFTVEALDKLF